MSDHSPVVCLSFTQWDTPYVKSTFKLMEALSKYRKVLIADYPYTWKDIAQARAGKKPHVPWRRCLGLDARMRNIELNGTKGLQVLSLPPVMPLNALPEGALYHTLIGLESKKLARTIREAIRGLGWDNPVVFNAFQPVFGLPLAGKLGEAVRLYYAYDEIGAANWAGKHGQPAETAYLQKVQGVVVSSTGLEQRFLTSHPDTCLVPNAVDEMFFRPQLSPPDPAQPLNAGFVGSIDDRIDIDLLERVIADLPGWTFHFLGRVVDEGIRQRLAAFSNVRIHGPKLPEELPGWMTRFQVGLLPYVKNNFTRGIYPMKLHEYLASGLPVLATGFGDMPLFARQVMIEEDPARWAGHMTSAVLSDTLRARQERRDFAAGHTWDGRAKLLDTFISSLEARVSGTTNEVFAAHSNSLS